MCTKWSLSACQPILLSACSLTLRHARPFQRFTSHFSSLFILISALRSGLSWARATDSPFPVHTRRSVAGRKIKRQTTETIRGQRLSSLLTRNNPRRGVIEDGDTLRRLPEQTRVVFGACCKDTITNETNGAKLGSEEARPGRMRPTCMCTEREHGNDAHAANTHDARQTYVRTSHKTTRRQHVCPNVVFSFDHAASTRKRESKRRRGGKGSITANGKQLR